MSVADYTIAENLILNNIELITKKLIVPICNHDSDTVMKIENILNVKLPNSYVKFLMQYGRLVFGGIEINGIDDIIDRNGEFYIDIIGITLDERKSYDHPVFPNYFISIYDLGDGEKYCLDTSKMTTEDKCPVVAWYFGRIEFLYEDFGAFFLDAVK